MSTPTPEVPQRTFHSPNYAAVGEALIGPPKGFTPAGPPEERRYNDVRLVARVQNFVRPIRRVEAGVLLQGHERRLVFPDGLPDGLQLPPIVLSTDFEVSWHAAGLLFADRELVRVDSRLSGWPEPPEPINGSYLWSREPVKPAASWPAASWALGIGFSVDELSTFSAAVGCLDVLRRGAHQAITEHVGLLPPRARLGIFAAAAKVLPGYSGKDAAGPYANELFGEALLEATTAADVPGLLTLVEGLAPTGQAVG